MTFLCNWKVDSSIPVSSELEFVLANKTEFDATAAIQQSRELENAAPGDVVDDLGLLDGCWGTYLESSSDSGFLRNLDLALVYKFDAAEARMESHRFTTFPFIPSFIVLAGAYEVSAADHITVRYDTITMYDVKSGGPVTEPADAQTSEPFDSFFTSSGVFLKQYLFQHPTDPDPEDPLAGIILRQFDCP